MKKKKVEKLTRSDLIRVMEENKQGILTKLISQIDEQLIKGCLEGHTEFRLEQLGKAVFNCIVYHYRKMGFFVTVDTAVDSITISLKHEFEVEKGLIQ